MTTLPMFLGGLAALVAGAELLVRGASRIASAPGIFPLVVGHYLACTAYVILAAAEHDALAPFSSVMAVFVLPLTALTLVILALRAWRRRRARAAQS